MKNKFFLWILIFLSISLLMQSLGKNKDLEPELNGNDLGLATVKTEYRLGKEVILKMHNNTDEIITLPDFCDDQLFNVYRYDNSNWIEVSLGENKTCDEPYALDPGADLSVSYKHWAYRAFSEYGRYHIKVNAYVRPNNAESKLMTFTSNEFTVSPRTLLGNLWLHGIYRPILNTLVFLIEVIPGHSLGLAIILLTLLIRTILLVPSQRAMRSQRRMQELQPKLEALKKQYKDKQELLAMETMKLWKEHKVSPVSSCLPIFIQFPILIALYYVVMEGLHADKVQLLYKFISDNFSFTEIQTNFLGILDLTQLNIIALPLIVGALQFIQMDLAMSQAKKKQENKQKSSTKEVTEKVKKPGDIQNEMQMATSMMKYFMPVMIAFFTASLPAGVGLYWGTSTIYGILQQIVVNKESLNKKPAKNEPTVRVVEK